MSSNIGRNKNSLRGGVMDGTILSRGYPETSVKAAESIDATNLELLVLETIQGFPDGCISDEVRRCHPDLA